jgi:hypothetical protein
MLVVMRTTRREGTKRKREEGPFAALRMTANGNGNGNGEILVASLARDDNERQRTRLRDSGARL